MSPRPPAASHLSAPPPTDRLTRFPGRRLGAGRRLYWIHDVDRPPLWCGSTGAMRFDLPAPQGTCYFAESPEICVVEVFGGQRAVTVARLTERRLSTIDVIVPLWLADLTSNRAVGHGLDASIASTLDYETCQAWAGALAGAGFTGLRYWARHDLAHRFGCVALFGPTGGEPAADALRVTTGPLLSEQSDVLCRVAAGYGIEFLPIPG